MFKKGANLGLKCARMRLAAGLHPDSLAELKGSPRPPSRNSGGGVAYLLLRRREGKGMGKGKKGREEGEGREGEGRADPRPGLGKCKGGKP